MTWTSLGLLLYFKSGNPAIKEPPAGPINNSPVRVRNQSINQSIITRFEKRGTWREQVVGRSLLGLLLSGRKNGLPKPLYHI